jgi:hypothetical protein
MPFRSQTVEMVGLSLLIHSSTKRFIQIIIQFQHLVVESHDTEKLIRTSLYIMVDHILESNTAFFSFFLVHNTLTKQGFSGGAAIILASSHGHGKEAFAHEGRLPYVHKRRKTRHGILGCLISRDPWCPISLCHAKSHELIVTHVCHVV